jgi:hypothetical protein
VAFVTFSHRGMRRRIVFDGDANDDWILVCHVFPVGGVNLADGIGMTLNWRGSSDADVIFLMACCRLWHGFDPNVDWSLWAGSEMYDDD